MTTRAIDWPLVETRAAWQEWRGSSSSQSRADAYLAAWQLLRHLPPELRLAVIEALIEIERASAQIRDNLSHSQIGRNVV